ncbi:hypothetical protein TNCV_594331 [Trichonephila clavipes]|nr:hypothetical protein TNCV_594331 [Trichonephila clavipes]
MTDTSDNIPLHVRGGCIIPTEDYRLKTSNINFQKPPYGRYSPKLVSKKDASLAVSPKLHQVSIEMPI